MSHRALNVRRVKRADVCRCTHTFLVLHAQHPPIIHLDLKSANVVLDSALTPKVCECVRAAQNATLLALNPPHRSFGISKSSDETAAVIRGTPAYSASLPA